MLPLNKLLKPDAKDIQASLVVFLVALPLCLGISLASNAPAQSGLVAGIIGGLIVGFFSPSALSVSGPAAGLTVIVASGIDTLGSFQAFAAATCVAGLMQIGLSKLRFGIVASFIPSSVIKGILAAIGIIIILKQIPHLFGVDADAFGDMNFNQADGENTFTEIFRVLGHVHMGAVAVSTLSAVVLLAWPKICKKISAASLVPAALIAVALSILANTLLLPSVGWVIEGTHLVIIPNASQLFQLPSGSVFSFFANPDFWIISLTICLVASIESLLSIDASEKLDPLKRGVDANQELLAQGLGNTLSGFFGGLPITAVIVRTSANISAGGVSQVSAIAHGLWLLAFVLLCPFLLNMIPLSCLAMVLIFVGYKLTEPKLFKAFWKKDFGQLVPFIATILAILFTDLLVGICIGFLVGITFVVLSSYHPAIVLVNDDNDYLLRFNKDTSFLNKPKLKSILRTVPEQSNLIVDGTRAVFIDNDIVEMIQDYVESAPQRNITVEVQKSQSALTPYFRTI
ncbi:MAG: SulP family inorganic anion transporter [Bdellovibrionaceae bacterium]|nr:SulP family inorganic anion transporter [Pseudobdellovibrionaceae bacterium]